MGFREQPVNSKQFVAHTHPRSLYFATHIQESKIPLFCHSLSHSLNHKCITITQQKWYKRKLECKRRENKTSTKTTATVPISNYVKRLYLPKEEAGNGALGRQKENRITTCHTHRRSKEIWDFQALPGLFGIKNGAGAVHSWFCELQE